MVSARGTTPLVMTVPLCLNKLNSLLWHLINKLFKYLSIAIAAYLKYIIKITIIMIMIVAASKPPITPPAIAPPEPPPLVLLLLLPASPINMYFHI